MSNLSILFFSPFRLRDKPESSSIISFLKSSFYLFLLKVRVSTRIFLLSFLFEVSSSDSGFPLVLIGLIVFFYLLSFPFKDSGSDSGLPFIFSFEVSSSDSGFSLVLIGPIVYPLSFPFKDSGSDSSLPFIFSLKFRVPTQASLWFWLDQSFSFIFSF